jgi:hypothetical protein
MQNHDWSVRAKILPRKGERRLLSLELDSGKHGEIMSPFEAPEASALYDSKVEQDFANRFKSLDTGWTLTREPEPIPVGRTVMIPDFGFQKGEAVVYMEVMGFWTPQYLREKLRKLTDLGDVDMIVAANRNLACQKLDRIGEKQNVIYYRRKIPLKPIFAHLKDREKRLVEKQTQHLRLETLPVHETVVEVKELAERLGVLEEAVKQALLVQEVPGYARLWDMLIKESTLEEIREKLEGRLSQGDLTLEEASRIVEEAGGKRPAPLLDVLGYKVEWHGIDPQTAKVMKRSEASA